MARNGIRDGRFRQSTRGGTLHRVSVCARRLRRHTAVDQSSRRTAPSRFGSAAPVKSQRVVSHLAPDQLAMSSGWLASSMLATASIAAMVSGRK